MTGRNVIDQARMDAMARLPCQVLDSEELKINLVHIVTSRKPACAFHAADRFRTTSSSAFTVTGRESVIPTGDVFTT